MTGHDRAILRDLATRYADVAADPVQEQRRDLWRRHNSLHPTRPLVYARAYAWHEMPQSACSCEDPLARRYEGALRNLLFWASLDDDSVFEPWLTVAAAHVCTGWGVDIERTRSDAPGGSFKVDYPLREPGDIERLREPWHEIDEEKTDETVSRLREAVSDLIEINVDRGPAYRMWSGDLSTDLGYLRGIEHFMVDMIDRPEWLHRLMAFLSAGVLKTHEEAEAAGDWGLSAHQNQAMPYALELDDPAPNANGVRRSALWGYMAAQEFTGVSPAMHEEFLLRYQLPILREFGLVAYGCCEDLSRKVDMLRGIPNLRRIAVSPFADVASCAEQIGTDYVVSYRPSPADMVSYDWDEERARAILSRDLRACAGCHVDITLKDVETVQGDPDRVRRWVALARRVAGEVFG